jgi:hypothetical protein
MRIACPTDYLSLLLQVMIYRVLQVSPNHVLDFSEIELCGPLPSRFLFTTGDEEGF